MRRGPRAAAIASLILLCAGAARAQQTPPPPPEAPPPADTLPRAPQRDSAAVPVPPEQQAKDTLPRTPPRDSAAADSLRSAPNFPTWPARGTGEWRGAYVFTRADLQYYQGLSLVELIERVPGMLVTRAGGFGRPAAISAYALGGGRLRVFLDGYELSPLASGTFDLQRIALADLGSVRVERGLAEVRIELTTFLLENARPYARIEAAEGDFGTQILRGFFARPLGRADVVQASYDLTDTNGFARREPYTATTFGARWSHLFGPDRGVELEYRGQLVTREAGAATSLPGGDIVARFAEETRRGDLIARARARVGSRLWLDAVVGRATMTPAAGDSISPPARALQLGARARLDLPFGAVGAEARLIRASGSGYAADALDLTARADLRPAPWLAAAGLARGYSFGGTSGVEAEGSVRVGPFGGISLFGALSGGARPLRYAADSALVLRTFAGLGRDSATLDTIFVTTFRSTAAAFAGARGGAEWRRRTALLGVAVSRIDPAKVTPFGLAFSATAAPAPGRPSSTAEAYGSVPLLFPWLRLDGWYVETLATGDRPYLPRRYAAASLQYHNTFFTGNLEPTARIEAVVRGPALAPLPGDADDVRTPTYALFNFFLQIRVIDVRAFVRVENLLNRRTAFDVPGVLLPGPRTMYGFSWFFRD